MFILLNISSIFTVHFTTRCSTHSSAPGDGRDHRPKHVELIGIIDKPLLLHVDGVYFIYIMVLLVVQNTQCRVIRLQLMSV